VLHCGQRLMAAYYEEEFIALLNTTGSIVKGLFSPENNIDFPTILEHIWKTYTIKSYTQKYFYKFLYFMQKKNFSNFYKIFLFL